MAQEGKEKRLDISYLEGVNAQVSNNIGKRTELVHAENARSKIIGTVEKREGQLTYGKNLNGSSFVAAENYGLFPFANEQSSGLYRISTEGGSAFSINTFDYIGASDVPMVGSSKNILTIKTGDNISITERVNGLDGNLVTIYYSSQNNQWVPLSQYGTGIVSGVFDYTFAENSAFVVNRNDLNRYIKPDGTTVVTSNDGAGHLYNSPPASKINYYKSRLYLADFVKFGVRYKTSILRSSYAMGIAALVNSDVPKVDPASGFWEIPITDNKYIYSYSGANKYSIYRGPLKVADINVYEVKETTILVDQNSVTFFNNNSGFLASDEIWVYGTFDGPKVFRWVNNPTISGSEVKQYDTFKLAGAENEEIKMLVNVGNVMMIGNNNNLATWNDYILESFDLNIGCVSNHGYVKNLGTLYFVHYSGIYATSGSIPKLISTKVQRYIDGATKVGKESSAAGKKGTSVFFTLGDVTLYNPDGSVDKILPDTCLEYNLVQENWFVHTNVKASEFTTFVETSNSDRLEFTDKTGIKSVKEFLVGETDDGQEIPFRIDTMRLTLQSQYENQNNPVAIITEVDRGSSIKTFIALDDDGFYPIEGDVVKGLSVVKLNEKGTKMGQPPTTRQIAISLRDSSKQLCKISRMSVIFTPTNVYNPTNDQGTLE